MGRIPPSAFTVPIPGIPSISWIFPLIDTIIDPQNIDIVIANSGVIWNQLRIRNMLDRDASAQTEFVKLLLYNNTESLICNDMEKNSIASKVATEAFLRLLSDEYEIPTNGLFRSLESQEDKLEAIKCVFHLCDFWKYPDGTIQLLKDYMFRFDIETIRARHFSETNVAEFLEMLALYVFGIFFADQYHRSTLREQLRDRILDEFAYIGNSVVGINLLDTLLKVLVQRTLSGDNTSEFVRALPPLLLDVDLFEDMNTLRGVTNMIEILSGV